MNGIIEGILAPIREGISDVEKAYYAYQYMIQNVQYDYSLTKYTAYDALVNKSAVCQGYMLAYTWLMNELDIPVKNVVSVAMNHGWNMIQIGSDWYYVDCTAGATGYAGEMFLRTEAELRGTGFHEMYDWCLYRGGSFSEGGTPPPSTESNNTSLYANYLFRNGPRLPVYTDGYWYYKSSNTLYKEKVDRSEGFKEIADKIIAVCDTSFMKTIYYARYDKETVTICAYNTKEQTTTEVISYSGVDHQIVSLKYENGFLKFTCSIDGVDRDISIPIEKSTVGIEVKEPVQTRYEVGDEWNPIGMEVYSVYSDKSVKREKDYTISGFSSDSQGTKTITVTCQGYTDTFSVSVQEVGTQTGIHVKKPAYYFTTIGETAEIKAQLRGITDTITYKSSDTNIVSISESGIIVAKKQGSAYVLVEAGGYTQVIYVVVDITDIGGGEEEDFKILYEYDDINQTAKVVGCSGVGTELNIPASVTLAGANYTVTKIEASEYQAFARIETLRVPSTVLQIEAGGFGGTAMQLGKLKTLTLPETCSIAADAFMYTSIETLTLGEGVVVGYGAFRGCPYLANVTINAKEVGDSVFSECTGLDSITFGKGVEKIGEHAFSDCNLSVVTIPEGVTEVGNYAFAYNRNLTEAKISSTVKILGGSLFYEGADKLTLHMYCTKIEVVKHAIADNKDVKYLFYGDFTEEKIALFAKWGEINYELIGNDSDIDPLPEDAEIFEQNQYNLNLGEKIKLKTRYYEYADLTFENFNKEIVSLDEDGVITTLAIGNAYMNVYDKDGNFLDYITVMVCDFRFEKQQVSMQIGDTLSLNVVSEPMSVANYEYVEYSVDGGQVIEVIGKETMSDTANSAYGGYGRITVEAKNIGSSILTITNEFGMKSNCLIEVKGNNITEFQDGVFTYRKVDENKLEITGAVEEVDDKGGHYWFRKNSDYYKDIADTKVLTIPAKVEFYGKVYKVVGVGEEAFFMSMVEGVYPVFNQMTEVIIEEGVTYLGNAAFKAFPMENISLPSTLKKIGNSVFADVLPLKEIVLPKKMTEMGYTCFKNSSIEKVIILSDIKVIPSETFYNCKKLTQVKLPDQIETIGTEAFADCINLAQIVLPKELVRLSDKAFRGCSSIKSISLPEKLKYMPYGNQFQECTLLKEIILLCTQLQETDLWVDAADVIYYVSRNKDNTAMLKKLHIADYQYLEDSGVQTISIQGERNMALGEKQTLNLVLQPESTLMQNGIEWTSSDTTVAVVTQGDVKAVGEGNVVITAKTLDQKSAEIELVVYKEQPKVEETFGEGFVALYNKQKVLGDLEIPEGWFFENPNEKLYPSEEVQYFASYYKEDNIDKKCKIPVFVAEITDAKIVGEVSLGIGEEVTYRIFPQGIGVARLDSYQVTWQTESLNNSKASKPGSLGEIVLTGSNVGVDTLKATLTMKDDIKFSASREIVIKSRKIEDESLYADANYEKEDFTGKTVEGYTLHLKVLSQQEKTLKVLGFSGNDETQGKKVCTIPTTISYGGEEWTIVKLGENFSPVGSLITTLVMPISLQEIHPKALINFRVLEKIVVDDNSPYLFIGEEGALYNKEKTYLYWFLQKNNEVFILPETIEDFNPLLVENGIEIPENSKIIQNDTSILTPDGKKLILGVEIPYGVEEIGSYAFYKVYREKIEIPETVYKIDEYGMANMVDLGQQIVVEFMGKSALSLVGRRAFAASPIADIKVPKSVQKIGAQAYQVEGNIRNFEVEENSNLSFIGYEAFCFYRYPVDYSFVIPATVTYLGRNAVNGDDVGSTYYLGAEPPKFEEYGFSSEERTHYVPTDSVNAYKEALQLAGRGSDKVVGMDTSACKQDALVAKRNLQYAVDKTTQEVRFVKVLDESEETGKPKIASITVDNKVEYKGQSYEVETIGSYALSDCKDLVRLILPEGIKKLKENACSRADKLRKLALPDSVTHIASNAFEGISSTMEVYVDKGKAAQNGADALSSIQVKHIGEDVFRSNGIFWTKKGGNATLRYAEDVFEIPESFSDGGSVYKLTEIEDIAYAGTRLDEVIIPEGVERIGSNVFYPYVLG